MSNSPLVDYTRISPNKTSPRNQDIDTITIHCVVGQLSVETIGNIFTPTSRKASCQYGIGADGRIGMYCEEKDRSWCTSSSSNDNRAITFEVACDTYHPYKVRDNVLDSLIDLLVDICKRNPKLQNGLRWQGDENLIGQVDKQNMTVHRWFANKACPGDYLYNLHGEIAKRVNEKLFGPSITLEEAEQVLLTEIGYSMDTVNYLYAYRYGDSLIIKLAEAFKNGIKFEQIGFEQDTIYFISYYKYATEFVEKFDN